VALRLAGVTPSPLLDQPAFAADGSAARLRTCTGDVTIAQDSGIIIYRSGQVGLQPNQKDPGWAWPHVTFQALGTRPMVLRYRLTALTSATDVCTDTVGTT